MRTYLRHVSWLFVALTVIIATSASLSAQTVSVTGRVEFLGDPKTRPSDLSGAVVWLTPLDSPQVAPSSRPVRLLQKRKTFSPHVVVIPVGSPVEFPNQDPFFHNVFSLFEGKRFDLGLYEAGSTRTVVFDRAGISYIFCNIHPEMSAVVISVRTPFYAMSDAKGALSIPSVPPGTYEMRVWHERVLPENLAKLTQRVQVSGTSTVLNVIRLAEQRNLTKSHKNKYGKDYDIPGKNGVIYKR